VQVHLVIRSTLEKVTWSAADFAAQPASPASPVSGDGHAMAEVHRIGFTRLEDGRDADGQCRCQWVFPPKFHSHD
jgi:hypothetical protein